MENLLDAEDLLKGHDCAMPKTVAKLAQEAGAVAEGHTDRVLDQVRTERMLQRGRFGQAHDDSLSDSYWGSLLATYTGLAAGKTLNAPPPTEEAELRGYGGDRAELRAAALKVAATAVAWAEAIDRREGDA